MTIAELIDYLRQYKPDQQVVLHGDDPGADDAVVLEFIPHL